MEIINDDDNNNKKQLQLFSIFKNNMTDVRKLKLKIKVLHINSTKRQIKDDVT